MRICIFGDAETPHVQRWCSALVEEGHKVLLLTLHVRECGGARVESLPGVGLGKLGYFLALRKARKLVVGFNPDIVHGHYLTGYGGLAARSAGDVPLVLSAWGSDVLKTLSATGPRTALIRRFVTPGLRKAASVTIETTALMDPLIRLGVPRVKIDVIPWGVDTELFSPETGAMSMPIDLRSGHGPVLLAIRSVKETYNTLAFLGAIARLRERHPELTAIILAGFRDSTYYERVIAKIRTERLGDNVIVVDKLLSAVELASIVVRSDAVVSIPAHDSLSVSVLEAAAAGRPLVLSHIPANLVLCESGVRAQFVGHSEEAIAAGILVAIGETARHEALENVKVVREKYSWGHSVVHMTALYERVLRDSKPAATSTLS